MVNQEAARTVMAGMETQNIFLWVRAFHYNWCNPFIPVFSVNLLPNLSFIFYFVKVPLGTVVKEQGKTVVDLSEHGQEYVAVFGGMGGKGNRFYLSNENRAPMVATPGMQGQERVLQLELRTMAHAGLVRRSCFLFGKIAVVYRFSTPQM